MKTTYYGVCPLTLLTGNARACYMERCEFFVTDDENNRFSSGRCAIVRIARTLDKFCSQPTPANSDKED